MEAAREVPLESGDLSDAGRDISELRKYLVEMMHSEMEMVESVKHHEANVAIVNAQIERVKELILQEQDRYKALKSTLENDEQEIKRIEEAQIVAAAKHKQDLDNVHYHENEIKLLVADYQHMRSAMLSLQRGSAQMTAILQRMGQDEAKMNEEINAHEKNSEALAVSDEQVASVKMLRARKRRIRQYSTELELKASEAHETRIRLEDELETCADKSAALRLSLQSEEREVEATQARTDEEVAEIVQETKRLKVKLEAKSKKFRSKIRMEIASLKKRVQFMTRELELETMTNEDVSSFLCERAFFRETTEMRLQEKIDRIKDIQQSIASLTAKISDFDQDDGRFNTDSLQEQLDTSRKEANTVAISLKMAQEKLKLADNDRLQLEDEIAVAKADIEGIIKAIAEVDTVSIKNAIADCGKNKAQLLRSITKSNQRNEVLLNEEARQRTRNAALAKAYKSLYLRLGKTNQLVSKTSIEIENQERSIQDLDDAIQDGERRRHRKDLQECQANLASRQKQMHQLLKAQEEALRQQYLDKQTVHQQELETWDAKIEALRVGR